jgi:mRNA interferase MazF
VIRRGEVVVVDFSPTDPNAKVRPALVIQNDRDNARLQKTIVVQITGNLAGAGEDTHLLIDQNHPDWKRSGLRIPSVVSCINIATVSQGHVKKTLGSISAATMRMIEDRLKTAQGIP